MNDNKGFQSMWIPLIIFVALGAAVVGVESVAQPVKYVGIEAGCADYTRDSGDNDGSYGFIEDYECWEYPYEDGLGETSTPIGLGGQSPDQYQPYFDLTVDFVRGFVGIECGGNLAGCLGTNFQYESQFYCFFSDNIMSYDFGSIFNDFFRTNPNIYGMNNDQSSNAFVNVCRQLSPPTGDLPIIEHQNSDPIAENTGGSERPPR